MKKQDVIFRFSIYYIIILFIICASPLLAETAYNESGGLVVVEIESSSANGDWTAETDMTGFTGSCYYTWTGSDYFNSPGHGIMEYKIFINSAGTYNFRIHNRHDFADSTEENDCFTKLDDGAWVKTFSSRRGSWVWNTNHEFSSSSKPPAEYNLSAGLHTLYICGRSHGFSIDRFHLYKDGVAGVTDKTQPVSSLITVGNTGTVSGELKKWHKVTITFDGPDTSETASTNPFTDYRLNVTFTNGATTYVVPGYYAADGDAGNTSASSGSKWRVHFAPDKTGTWNYTASFRTGNEIAVSLDAGAGSSAGFCDGASGSFNIGATDKSGRDHRGKGRLRYVGKHHLQFAETGEYFLKCGADAPENFLAYEDFDGNFKSDGVSDNRIKSWSPHAADWNTGDPTWGSGKGKGMIGAINYLSSEGMNAFSFLTMNIGGDDKNCFPYLNYNNNTAPQADRLRYDCSRLDQWEVVFEHGDHKGMYLHFKTQETENDQLLDGGALGLERKLYYRELVARFGHHLALNWNLGEENTNTDAQRKAFAQYLYDIDPYHHNIVVHSYPGQDDTVFGPMLGSASKLTGTSIQTSSSTFDQVHGRVKEWVDKSANAAKPWIVAIDEPGDASHALVPDSDDPTHDTARKNGLWGAIMAGGAGLEWYFGYQHDESDLTCEDWRSRDLFWDQCRYALEFFKNNSIPFQDMFCDNSVSSASADYCFYLSDSVYVVYLKNGGSTNLELSGASGTFEVKWYDPRNGGGLLNGSVTSVEGGGSRDLGSAPNNTTKDWAVLVRKTGTGGNTAPSVNAGADQSLVLPDLDADLDGTVTDDGLPDPPASVSVSWTKESGPGSVSFGNSSAVDTTATFGIEGVYVLRLTADDGELSSSDTITITITDPAAGDSVVSFTLINADTDQPMSGFDPLADGATINLATLPSTNLNIRANTNPTTVGSVKFGYDGNASYQIESVAPYALEGDSSGNYNAWTPAVGNHTLTGTPYSAASAGGTAGTPLTINFTVTNNAGTTYTLTVNSGNGDGTYSSGDVVNITADAAPAGKEFDAWTGDVGGVADVSDPTTTITMPAQDAAVTATYIDTPVVTYTLTVNSGTGDGDYGAGDIAYISADTPPAGQEFDQWTGDTAAVADIFDSTTDLTMPSQDVTVTAVYKDISISQGPFGGTPWAVPGVIEAEDYDTGGEGISYHDSDSTNQGGEYRTDGVDVQVTTDTGGGYNVGWTANGEWLEYTVDVASAGDYDLVIRAARGQTGDAEVHVELDGVDITGQLTVASTGDWQSFTNVTAADITLSAGQHVMRVSIDSGGVNLNYMEWSTSVSNTPPTVDAGSDTSITLPTNSLSLNGSVTDPDDIPVISWSKVSGPGTVSFADDTALDTSVSFSAAGAYVLKLTADDGVNPAVSDNVTITVNPDPADDADGDGMNDLWEIDHGLDPTDPDDGDYDLDLDGLTNHEEFQNDTDPFDADSDNDGYIDLVEIQNSTDPNDPNDVPDINLVKKGEGCSLSVNGSNPSLLLILISLLGMGIISRKKN